jgi:hypothetical protein
MARNKRTKFEIERDRNRIAAMYLRGMYQSEIAAELGVSQPQISYDLKAIQAQWRATTTLDLDEAKQREIARIDELERTYWQAWEESKGERTRQSQESGGVDHRGQPIIKKRSLTKESMLGNPAYLVGVQWCISERCKLLGIYAAVKQELRIDVTNLSDEELQNIIES